MTDETRKVLVNPFHVGETVTIPAGTIYTSTDPELKGRQRTKRAETVVVDATFPASLTRTPSNQLLVRPQRIRVQNHGGYAKDFNITEKIVRLNGKLPVYEQLSVDV
jgi:hypothetical protein